MPRSRRPATASPSRSRSLRRRLARWAALLVAAWVVVTALPVILMRWWHPATSAFMLQARIEAVRERRDDYRTRYEWVDLEAISPHAAVAVIAAEDQRFAAHRGFDVEAIRAAMRANADGRRLRGASTITQQVAKNLFLWPGRSWLRKGLEAWYTVLLELLWPKQRILEVYLNVAEFGRGVYGVEAAAQAFFAKPAARLTRHEAALLAAVLPSPRRMRAERPSPYVASRQQWILRQMRGLGGTSHLQLLAAEPQS